jgi:hypothetical protein
MLSHHELATLLRLRDTEPRQAELDPEVLALSRYELVEIRRLDKVATLKLTSRGRELVRRLGMDTAETVDHTDVQ